MKYLIFTAAALALAGCETYDTAPTETGPSYDGRATLTAHHVAQGVPAAQAECVAIAHEQLDQDYYDMIVTHVKDGNGAYEMNAEHPDPAKQHHMDAFIAALRACE